MTDLIKVELFAEPMADRASGALGHVVSEGGCGGGEGTRHGADGHSHRGV